jgi:predicted nucleic acid-binding Zn ribbon protein
MQKKLQHSIGAACVTTALFFSAAMPLAVSADQTQINDIVHGNKTQWNYFTRGFGVTSYGDVIQPGQLVQRITAIFFGILGLIAVVMVMYSGFLWLTAAGEEEKTKKATTLLFQSFVGLIIILASWTLTYFVISQLTRAIIK